VLNYVKQAGRQILTRTEGIFDAVFGHEDNPFYQLGALTIFFFWVVLVSGIYVFIFFETSVTGAYESVDYLTRNQWYLGGIMRSLHRYASDAAIITIAVHILREFVKDRYRGPRWFSWFTGVPQLWIVFPLGITGYWLVWDQLAVHVATISAELLDWLPIFTDPMARNFLTVENVSDRFFTLLGFIHLLGLPLFLIFGIWFHVLRITQPRVNPSRRLVVTSLAMLVVLSLINPALSQAPANLGFVPQTTDYDWFYLFMYALHESSSATVVWSLLFGGSLLLILLPWLPPLRQAPVAQVDPDHCNGCGRCFNDCPYTAISMEPRTDDSPYDEIAVVDPSHCVSCGICAGACPYAIPFRSVTELQTGIDLPQGSIDALRRSLKAQAESLTTGPRLAVFGCTHAASVGALAGVNTVTHEFPCIGNLPPTFVDYALKRLGLDGVLVTGCPPAECYHRLGSHWTGQRFARQRDPQLRSSIDPQRVHIYWARANEQTDLEQEVTRFRQALDEQAQPARQSQDGNDENE